MQVFSTCWGVMARVVTGASCTIRVWLVAWDPSACNGAAASSWPVPSMLISIGELARDDLRLSNDITSESTLGLSDRDLIDQSPSSMSDPV